MNVCFICLGAKRPRKLLKHFISRHAPLKCTFINSKTAQQLIYVHKDGNEFCFPWHEKFVKNIDTKKGIMEVEIPKEFLDLN